ncbi:hypothetical protein HYX07_01260 [Candidatus Woesearchaeota archaeon]|nr:hypothetical protein [Candidatus Woesearchaeota archaeon]
MPLEFEPKQYTFYSEVSLPAPQYLKSLHAQRHTADPQGIVRLISQFKDGGMDVKFCRRIGKPQKGLYKWGAFPTRELDYASIISWDNIYYFERRSPEVKIFEMIAGQNKE